MSKKGFDQQVVNEEGERKDIKVLKGEMYEWQVVVVSVLKQQCYFCFEDKDVYFIGSGCCIFINGEFCFWKELFLKNYYFFF